MPALFCKIWRDILRGAGFEIAGCAGSVDKALSALKDSDCDIAILDANLRGQSVESVAKALQYAAFAQTDCAWRTDRRGQAALILTAGGGSRSLWVRPFALVSADMSRYRVCALAHPQ
jgi:DNA-binding response OmpR family regulator